MKRYENTILDEDKLKHLLETDYSDFDPDDKPIYRSIDATENFLLVKSITDRPSAYIKHNYYTLLIKNLPSWSKYPKRQFICSTTFRYFGDTMYRVIPKNGAKIAVCPEYDIQANFKYNNKLGKELINDSFNGLSNINNYLYDLDIKYDNWETFVKSLGDTHLELKQYLELKQLLKQSLGETLGETSNLEIKLKYTNINELDRLINPDLGFEVYDYKDYVVQNFTNKEVWLDSDILLVPFNYFD